MDNGHPKGNTENPYFTAGVGNFSPEVNDEPENSLDEKEWQKALEISTPVGMPPLEKPQDTTEAIISGPQTEQTEQPSQTESPEPALPTSLSESGLGQIVPSDIIPKNQQTPDSAHQSKYNPVNIKTTGDKLEKSTIPEIDNVINELNQTGDLTNFYDEIRGTDEKPGMFDANIGNSFNRKLGQDQSSGQQGRVA